MKSFSLVNSFVILRAILGYAIIFPHILCHLAINFNFIVQIRLIFRNFDIFSPCSCGFLLLTLLFDFSMDSSKNRVIFFIWWIGL